MPGLSGDFHKGGQPARRFIGSRWQDDVAMFTLIRRDDRPVFREPRNANAGSRYLFPDKS